MTLVVTYTDHEMAILVSDQRMTGPKGFIEENACKSVLIGGKAVIGFTGIARLEWPSGRKHETGTWMADILFERRPENMAMACDILKKEGDLPGVLRPV